MIVCLLLIAGCGPRPDTREELAALERGFNEKHIYGVFIEEEYDPQKHFGYIHDKRFYFHLNCRTCNENCRILCRKHELLHRHPEWRPKPKPPSFPQETPPPANPVPEPKSVV